MSKRSGVTLIETLIIVAIVGILIALLIPAVLKVREAGLRTESMNNIKQIVLAVQNYASDNDTTLPVIDSAGASSMGSSFYSYLYLYIGQQFPSLLVSPLDPNYDEAIKGNLCSYAANGQVFLGSPRMPQTFLDGTSNTIILGEHYAKCGDWRFSQLSWGMSGAGTLLFRRPTIADPCFDTVPVTQGNPPSSMSSDDNFPNLTFQVAPSTSDCLPYVAQTPHAGGMLVALGDGSVHQLSAGIFPATYWGMLTPAGGELLNNEW